MKAAIRISVFLFIFSVFGFFGSILTRGFHIQTPHGFQPALAEAGEDEEAPLTEVWSDQGPTGFSRVTDLAIDEQDNIITTIWDFVEGLIIRKYDPEGTILWERKIPDGYIGAVDIDSSNNVIIATDVSTDLFIRKYSPDGHTVWSKTYDSGLNDCISDVTCDNDGNIIVFGEKFPPDVPYSPDWLIVKYDKDGNLLWTQTYDSEIKDYPGAVAVDSKQNIIAVGYFGNISYNPPSGDIDILIRKYDPDGNLLYHEEYDSGQYFDYANNACVDKDDNIIVVGSRKDGEGNDHLYVRKYRSDTYLLWDAEESDVISQAYTIAISKNERILVGGTVEGTEQEKGKKHIVCYDASGNELWDFAADPTELNDIIYGLAVDSHNNIGVGGSAGGAYLTEKYGYCYVGIENIKVKPGEEITVPLMLYNSPGVGCCGVKLSYDPETVLVTDATQGDFTSFFGFNDLHAGDGWVTVNTYITCTDLIGDLVVANVTLKAVGDVGNSSLLSLEILAVADQNGNSVPTDTDDGTFTIQPLPCVWDFDDDLDVDGSDLAKFLAGYGISYDEDDLSAFAREFGKTNCLEE